MFKITYEKGHKYSTKCFSLHQENHPRYSSCFLTLFWKTFQIKYSSKFNYFYVAKQVRRNHEILDSLAMCFISDIIQEKTQKTLSSLVKITEGEIGHSNDYIFRGILDGEDVFIKVLLGRLSADNPDAGAMQNEYEKGLIASSDCPYFVKPLHYIRFSKCEILITPFIQNLRTVYDVIYSSLPTPEFLKDQISETASYLKNNNLLHRDLNINNMVIGNINDEKTQFFLIDCSFMAFLDSEGHIIPTPIESSIQGRPRCLADEEKVFARILEQLDAKTVAEG